MEKGLIGFNIVMYFVYRFLLALMLVACGSDDSSSNEESDKQYRPTLWTEQELSNVVDACAENAISVTQSVALIADLYGTTTKKVAEDVINLKRIKIKKELG